VDDDIISINDSLYDIVKLEYFVVKISKKIAEKGTSHEYENIDERGNISEKYISGIGLSLRGIGIVLKS